MFHSSKLATIQIHNKWNEGNMYANLTEHLHCNRSLNKPNAVCDYNNNMKGVGYVEQMVKYHFARKCHKWMKKITFYFMQMTVHNAFVLYQYYTTDIKKLTLLQFHEVIIWSLLNFDSKKWPFQNDNIRQMNMMMRAHLLVTTLQYPDLQV